MRKVLAYIGAGIGGLIGLAIAAFAGWGLLHIDNLIRGEEISKLAEAGIGAAAGLVICGLIGFVIWALGALGERYYD